MCSPKTSNPLSRGTGLAAAILLGGVMLAGALPGPAHAQGNGDLNHNRRGSWQERGRQDEHWRPEHRFDGYYGAPPVIFVPAPSYYVQPGYYQEPGVSLNFNFPLFR
jgi:hypothetical protein